MEVNNLIDNVRDFFSEQYEGVENSNSFLAFEALGTIIDPNDFKDENDEISEIKATEELSILGDRLPEIDDIFLTNTSRLSSLYQMLLEGSQFNSERLDTDDLGPYLSRFAEVKKDAIFKYNEAVKASIERPEGNYLPVYGSPSKWYDPKGSFWQKKTFSKKENKPSSRPKNTSIKNKTIPFLWKTNFITDPQVLKAAIVPTAKIRIAQPVKISPVKPTLRAKPIQVKMATAMMPVAATAKLKKGPVTVKASKRVKNIATARTGPFKVGGSVKRRPQIKPKPSSPIKARVNKPAAKWSNLKVLKHLDIAERAKITSQIAQHNSAPQEPVKSDGFEMSFDYCMVSLERRWYDTTFFQYSKLWYGLSLDEDYFSTGTKDESNAGALKCIPKAMILIKDLKIKASWSKEDKQHAKNSDGLGIFNLSESTFTNNELSNSGMQIIGWMCEVLPKLPETSDPNLV